MTTTNRKLFEICAVLFTGALKFVIMEHFNQKLLFIILAISFWLLYLFYTVKQNKGVLAYWGFTKINAKATFKFLFPPAIASLILFLIIGVTNDQAIFSWHIIPIILIYPIWGILQQFLIMSLFAGNLMDQQKLPISKTIVILLTALFFGAVHLPYTLLAIGTSLLALVYTYTFLKYRNLWWLGIFHGVLGALFYYLVLGRDTFNEVFLMLS